MKWIKISELKKKQLFARKFQNKIGHVTGICRPVG
jgi:hypothetical protein